MLQMLSFNVTDMWCSRRRGSAWCWMLHAIWVVVLMMLQHFVSRVSSATLTCCDICILMFHCDLANVANVEFRCCRHVMLVLCQGGGGGGRSPDVGCCTHHGSQHGRNMWGRGKKDVWCLDVARNLIRNMLGTRSQHTRDIVRWMLQGWQFATWEKLFAISQKLFATFARLATRSTADKLPSPESSGSGSIRC
jgi:hypothetical protein